MNHIPEIWFHQLEKKGALFISKKSVDETSPALLKCFLSGLRVEETKSGDLIVKKF